MQIKFFQAILPFSSASPTFRRNISPPFSGSNGKPDFSKRNSLSLPPTSCLFVVWLTLRS
jgi:hypothetical protein